MKKSILTLVLILIAVPTFAQPGPMMREAHDEIANILKLTPDQQAAWQSAHSDFAAANRTLFDSQNSIAHQIDTALKSTSPDACSIGNLMIQQKGVQDQLKTAHDGLVQKLESTLTADQKLKLEAILATREMHERVPGPGARP